MLRIAFHIKKEKKINKSRHSQGTYIFSRAPARTRLTYTASPVNYLGRVRRSNQQDWVTQWPPRSPMRSPLEEGQTECRRDELAQGWDLGVRPGATSDSPATSRRVTCPGLPPPSAPARPAHAQLRGGLRMRSTLPSRGALTASGLASPPPRVAEAFGAPCCQP